MKKWKKPQLLVLCRSNPEEVLGYTCKVPGNATTSMIGGNGTDCASPNPIGAPCINCNSTSGS